MGNEAASAFSSLWSTYVLQFGAAYMVLWLVCRFVRDPQFRFRLCGVFLGAMVAAWTSLFLLLRSPAPAASQGAVLPSVSDSHTSWTLSLASTPEMSTILSGLGWAYAVIVALLLLSLGVRFWQLKTLLRASLPPPDCLSELFESVRLSVQAPSCELRLMPGLRSPATSGWWRPRILLPSEIVSALETPQLQAILRHELTHVRRRDYLWDRLATLACYIVFFHPAAWLVRSRLRWDRELVCDDGSVERSDLCRLEYAACLTAMAHWQLSGEDFAGAVDFLSPPSLLSARVRAMVSPAKAKYSWKKGLSLAFLTVVFLALALRLAPVVTFSPVTSAPSMPQNTVVTQKESHPRPQPVPYAEPKHVLPQHRVLVPRTTAQPLRSGASTSKAKNPRAITDVAATIQPQTQPDTKRRPALWHLFPKVGGWAMRSVKVGFSKVGSHLAGDRRQKEPPKEPPSGAANTGAG